MTTDRRVPRDLPKKLAQEFLVLGMIGIAAFAGSHRHGDAKIVFSIVHFVAIGGAIAFMIWDRGRRTELDRLIFYKATTVAFCAMLAGGLVYSVLEDANVVEMMSTGDVAEYGVIAWLLALIFFRRRSL
jgi:hypothetical protein